MANTRTIPTLPKLKKRKRVCAYARVSTGKDTMLHSLSAQVSNYSNYIQSNREWLYVGVYTDEAISGTKEDRAGFTKMIQDCEEGKIDMIITKSISRFARNTIVLLDTVRRLKELNVDVYFEEQNIYTLSGDGELMLSILASFAQEEAKSVSENMKWRIKRDFEEGLIWGGRDLLGYKLVDKKLVVVPEEAKLIKRMFQMYLDGNGDLKIYKTLLKEGVKNQYGEPITLSTIHYILTNIHYTGNLLLQKTYVPDYMTKKKKHNHGQVNKYYAEETHEAIIDLETFNKVQEIRASRTPDEWCGNSELNKFTGLVYCGYCGKRYVKKKNPYRTFWSCSTLQNKGADACNAGTVREDTLMNLTCKVLNIDEFSEDELRKQIERIDFYTKVQKAIFTFKDGRKVEVEIPQRSRKNSWTEEMKEQARLRSIEQHKLRRSN